MKKRIVVGATGASGIPLLVKCLELIREADGFESWLILSDSALLTMRQETNLTKEEMEQMADMVGIINHGTLIYQGSMAALEAQGESLEEVFIKLTGGGDSL